MKIGNRLSANCVKCDVAGCTSLFHSYSTVRIIRKQAKSAGWKRVSRASVMRAFSLPAEGLTGGALGRRVPVAYPATTAGEG